MSLQDIRKLLILDIFTTYSSVFIANFEHVIAGWNRRDLDNFVLNVDDNSVITSSGRHITFLMLL